MSEAVFGLDGGGTKTVSVVVDQNGTIVSLSRGEGCNPFDRAGWQEVLRRSIGTPHVVSACLGIAGYGESRPIMRELEDLVAARLTCPYVIRSDVELAFIGAFGGEAGLLLLSGTGSIAWAGDGQGKSIRIGGWGGLLGDEGSAYWIGRETLSCVTQALDGRARNHYELIAPVLNSLGISSSGDVATALLEWSAELSQPRASVAAIARCTAQLAQDGVASAVRIMDLAAMHLHAHIVAARRAMNREDLPWSFAGGVFHSPLMQARMAGLAGVAAQPPLLPPIGGAVVLAARLAQWDITPSWIAQLARDLRAVGF